MKTTFSKQTTGDVARLSNLSVDPREEEYFTKQFNETLAVVGKLNKINTSAVKETSHVTGLTNVLRDDALDDEQRLTQNQALRNAAETHSGYFVVKSVFHDQ